jgi:hypothetical protein
LGTTSFIALGSPMGPEGTAFAAGAGSGAALVGSAAGNAGVGALAALAGAPPPTASVGLESLPPIERRVKE